MKKIIFVSNLSAQAEIIELLDIINSFCEIGLEEILFIYPDTLGDFTETEKKYKYKIIPVIQKKITPEYVYQKAADENASVIVININDKNKPVGFSMLKNFVNYSPCPVLLLKIPENNRDNIFSHTIFATDWSSESHLALQYLTKFKKAIEEMEIINVINRKLTIRDMRNLKEKIETTRASCLEEDIDAEAHIYAGQTHSEIFTAAKDYKGSIIIMGGPSKKHKFYRFFKGCSAYKVIGNTELPVMIIPNTCHSVVNDF